VQLVVEAARVADGLALVVPPPQGRVLRAAVGAAEAQSPRGRLKDGALNIKSKIIFIKFRTGADRCYKHFWTPSLGV